MPPSQPVPTMSAVARSRSFSAATRLALGVIFLLPSAAAGAAAFFGSSFAGAAAAGASSASTATPPSSSSAFACAMSADASSSAPATTAIGSVTGILSPALISSALTTPSPVASISMFVLSVSTEKRGSPFFTASPSFLYHSTSFPSSMLKPSFGMMIISAISIPPLLPCA